MMPDRRVAKIMRTGVAAGIVFMLAGFIFTVAGRYDESVGLSLANVMDGSIFTDGAGLMYLGTLFIILTPAAVLVFLVFYFIYSPVKKYALYCGAMILVLIIVVLMRV